MQDHKGSKPNPCQPYQNPPYPQWSSLKTSLNPLLLPNSIYYTVSIFHQIEEPDSSAYNIMIRGFIQNKSNPKVLVLFKNMLENSVPPDEFTFPSILKACKDFEEWIQRKWVCWEYIDSYVCKLCRIRSCLQGVWWNVTKRCYDMEFFVYPAGIEFHDSTWKACWFKVRRMGES